MRGTKFVRFAKFIFEWKTPSYVWVYLFAIRTLYEEAEEASSPSNYLDPD